SLAHPQTQLTIITDSSDPIKVIAVTTSHVGYSPRDAESYNTFLHVKGTPTSLHVLFRTRRAIELRWATLRLAISDGNDTQHFDFPVGSLKEMCRENSDSVFHCASDEPNILKMIFPEEMPPHFATGNNVHFRIVLMDDLDAALFSVSFIGRIDP
ncbi:hypothetical protein PENTCL1PPCAC_24808, partial [Pristionchus entomophagus]